MTTNKKKIKKGNKNMKNINNINNKELYTIKINSFSGQEEEKAERNIPINLTKYFDGRFLKDNYSWEGVFYDIKKMLHNNLPAEKEYIVELIAHYPIAFMAGRILNPTSGIKTIPIQKTANGNEIWGMEGFEDISRQELDIDSECISKNNSDIAVIIGITRNIEENVKEYITEAKLSIGDIYNLSLQNPSIDAVKNGEHARRLVKQIDGYIQLARKKNMNGKLHIFFAGPIAIMFKIGQMSLTYGSGYIHDYDFGRTNKYYPTLNFAESDWI